MSISDKTLAVSEVALTITTLEPDVLDRHLTSLSAERVAEFAIRAATVARVASQAKLVANARLSEMGGEGQIYRDPLDDRPYQFTGGRHRAIKNVAGFVAQLAAEGIDARPLVPWLSSNAFRVGSDIVGDERIKVAVKEWAEWIDDPLTLVELDPKTMRPVRR